MNLEIQRSQYLRPKVTVHKCVETIQGRKLYEEIRYVELFFQMKSIESERNYLVDLNLGSILRYCFRKIIDGSTRFGT